MANQTPHLLLVGIVTPTTIQTALVEAHRGLSGVLRVSPGRTYTSQAEAVVAIDAELQELGPESEPVNEIVFALEPDWVEQGAVLDTHKPILKALTQKLSLRAVGFVVVTESWRQAAQEAGGVGSILVYLTETTAIIQPAIPGQKFEAVSVGVSGNLAADIVEGLARLSSEAQVWPSRISLAGFGLPDSRLVAEQQALIQAGWTTTYGWRHQPTVDVVTAATLSSLVASQAGEAAAFPDEAASESGETDASSDSDEDSDGNLTVATSFGVPIPGLRKEMTPTMSSQGSDMGKHAPSKDDLLDESDTMPDDQTPPNKKRGRMIGGIHMGGLRRHRGWVFFGFGSGILALLGIAVAASAVLAQAAITITLPSKVISKDETVVVDPTATATKPDQKILAGTLEARELDGSKSSPTSGVKVVGEKAAGVIVLINKTDSVKTFPAKTVLKASNRSFELVEETKVASSSVTSQSSTGQTTTFGRTEAKIEATQLGEEGNLAKDTVLKIGDFSDNTYSAIVKDGLSGGTSREARVVSEKDQDRVVAGIAGELEKKLEEDLKKESGNGTYFALSGAHKLVRAEYSAKAGEEAESLSVDAKFSFSVIKYAGTDLEPLAVALLQSQIPDGYTLSSEPPSILSSPVTEAGSATASQSATTAATVKLQMNISSKAVPKVDRDQVAAMAVSKLPAAATAEIQTIVSGSQVKIEFEPSIAGWLWPWLPSTASRVRVVWKE